MNLSLALRILLSAPPLLIAVILHEVAHGYIAEKLGDSTARDQGRITLNPIKHIDPFFTLLLPALLIASGSPVVFGGAKPVPVNWLRFKNPRRGMMWVALAGPVTNFILAAIAYGLIVLFYSEPVGPSQGLLSSLFFAWLVIGLLVNISLGVFNLIPIPPLDGGRIAVGLLPVPLARLLARLEPFGIILVFLLLMTGIFDQVFRKILEFVGALSPLS